jgi:hypothetical protein
MGRLGFVYKKPQLLPARADEVKQAAFIAKYEALMMGLRRMRWLSYRMQYIQSIKADRPMASFQKLKKWALKQRQDASG